MRRDMSKVIVERPRRGGGRDRKRRQAREFDDMPSKQSMKRGHTDLKDLNENLAPLKRYLRKNVGRPWDKVFSEICENIRMDNAVQKHVRGHVFDYVHLHVIVEGKMIFTSRFWGVYELWNGDLYVCPKSGLLKEYHLRNKARSRRISPLDESLKGISSEKSRTVVEGNEVFKVYRNPDTGEFDLRNPARPVHAEIDFNETLLRRGLKALDLFFTGLLKTIPMNHPYWITYGRLYREHKAKLANPKT
jgi:hypothetical protein